MVLFLKHSWRSNVLVLQKKTSKKFKLRWRPNQPTLCSWIFQSSSKPSSRCLFPPPPCQSRFLPSAPPYSCCFYVPVPRVAIVAVLATVIVRRLKRLASPPHHPELVVNIYASCHFFCLLSQLFCVRAGGVGRNGRAGCEQWCFFILRKKGRRE